MGLLNALSWCHFYKGYYQLRWAESTRQCPHTRWNGSKFRTPHSEKSPPWKSYNLQI